MGRRGTAFSEVTAMGETVKAMPILFVRMKGAVGGFFKGFVGAYGGDRAPALLSGALLQQYIAVAVRNEARSAASALKWRNRDGCPIHGTTCAPAAPGSMAVPSPVDPAGCTCKPVTVAQVADEVADRVAAALPMDPNVRAAVKDGSLTRESVAVAVTSMAGPDGVFAKA